MEAEETNKVPYIKHFAKKVDAERILIDFKKISPSSYIICFLKSRFVENNFYELFCKKFRALQVLAKPELNKIFRLLISKRTGHISKVLKSISNQIQVFAVQKKVIQAVLYQQKGVCPGLTRLKA
ncbi:MAG TPA: hypothetical protein VMT76_12510 [Puia sp.]|nr:hypothetical protein [Puia sp.]